MQDEEKKQDSPASGENETPSNEAPSENLADELPDDIDLEEGLDDIDIDDVDLDDDFEDVSWDDFDEGEATKTGTAPAKKAKGVGFIKKNLTKILIGGAVVGVIIIFFGTMSQTRTGPGTGLGPGIVDKTATNDTGNGESRPESGFMDDPSQLSQGLQTAEKLKAEQAESEGLPPMPTPVQTQAVEEDEALTPMINFSDTDTNEEASPEPSQQTGDENEIFLADISESQEKQPETPATEPQTENTQNKGEDSPIAYAEKQEITIEPLDSASSAPPQQQQPQNPGASDGDAASSQKIAELETFLTHSSADTNAQIAALNNKIAELSALVESLSKQTDNALDAAKNAEKLAASKAAPAPAPMAATPPSPAPKAESPKAQAPKPAPKAAAPQPSGTKAKTLASTQAKTTAKPRTSSTPASNTQWQLRGASEGQAMIGQKGTNELITVKVGDNVRNLGKITFIGQENGKWVVRGTGGKVSQ